MRSGFAGGIASLRASFAASFRFALVTVLVSGFTATLIAGFIGGFGIVLTASLGVDPRSAVIAFAGATTFAALTCLGFRVSLPLVRFKDIIPSGFQEIF